ncbi:uncharacterized protein LOC127135406 [Lathyrus oleraceus]|uniref:uncharacterized protein LOC127135406 n=1 Tax=Pisum sativum TaxID=3888 RepID=UPI001FC62102|nr:uncharacterized protein LOC127135406 [Pisum sativum]
MEDLNLLAADCVVISCCCQCLMLQIILLLLRKMVRKTREYGKRIFCQRKGVQREMGSYKDVILRVHEKSFRIQDDDVHNCGCCIDEVEKVMEELCEKGEFGFGSFWGRKEPWGDPKVVNDQIDVSSLRYQIVDF